jgi:hypothetical protein
MGSDAARNLTEAAALVIDYRPPKTTRSMPRAMADKQLPQSS